MISIVQFVRRVAPLAPVAFLVFAGCSTTPAAYVSPRTSIVEGHAVVRPVALAGNGSPFYPMALRRAGVEGLVNVDCVIDSEGKVMNATIADSTNQALNYSTLQTVRGWRFEPATRDGVPVAMAVRLPVGYEMGL